MCCELARRITLESKDDEPSRVSEAEKWENNVASRFCHLAFIGDVQIRLGNMSEDNYELQRFFAMTRGRYKQNALFIVKFKSRKRSPELWKLTFIRPSAKNLSLRKEFVLAVHFGQPFLHSGL